MREPEGLTVKPCIRVTQLCAWLALFAAAAGAQTTTNESMTVGPGTLNYQMTINSGTCGQYGQSQYTIYGFQNFSFVASGLSQSLQGGWSWTDVTGSTTACPTTGLHGPSVPFDLTGSSGYTITITSITSDQNFAAAYSGSFANVSPGGLTFAGQDVGTISAPQNITVSNTGTTDLSTGSVAISGANSGDFSIQSNNCGTVAAGASCTISVAFTPTATGARSASLTISDNSPTSPHTVVLTGSGVVGTSVSLPSASISSGTYTYVAADSLTAGTGNFVIAGGTNVTFEAGNQIVLQPGFTATAGTAPVTFHAFIGMPANASSSFTQSNSPSLSYTGSWQQAAISGTYGTSEATATATGASVSFTFTGTQVAFAHPTGPTLGLVQVAIDGTAVATIDEYSDPASEGTVEIFTGLTDATHTVTLSVTGQWDIESTGGFAVALDGFFSGSDILDSF